MQDKVKRIGHLFLSVLLALVLFFYATTTNYKNSLANKQSTESETYTHTLTGVPVDINYDNENYFISGFASTVTVDLTGSNRVILQRESDEVTRTFRVVADLTELESGTHTVDLQISNLPSGVNAATTPASLTIKIGKKVSKSFAVQGVIADSQLANGYMVSRIAVNVDSVKVTTDEETMDKIDRVEAVVLDADNLSENYTGTATLQAVDSQGALLPVVFSQDEATLQAVITESK
ncbi:CdaR family protein [Streptococcus oriscaviae]|uniref:YbbR-like protein n=1 Tax=Streptococcus oriscaviae TaxID=2781599 RepID=A0ABX7YLM9_9STRE|nr:CdaR family protein [Streptococcus oriscaviae]QUE54742.1 hypothetical protein INT76_02320 [Streptococcus oriscaviae]